MSVVMPFGSVMNSLIKCFLISDPLADIQQSIEDQTVAFVHKVHRVGAGSLYIIAQAADSLIEISTLFGIQIPPPLKIKIRVAAAVTNLLNQGSSMVSKQQLSATDWTKLAGVAVFRGADTLNMVVLSSPDLLRDGRLALSPEKMRILSQVLELVSGIALNHENLERTFERLKVLLKHYWDVAVRQAQIH